MIDRNEWLASIRAHMNAVQPGKILSALLLCTLLAGTGEATAQGRQAAFIERLIQAGVAQTRTAVTYDGSYRRIAYPGGDVPPNIGVCTDLVIRAYRAVDIDLQVLVHEDMKHSFDAYPRLWGLARADPNIDHRRVPNLQTYFRRRGAALPIDAQPNDFRPGDLVTWMLPGNLPHIGLVTDRRSSDGKRWLIVHNIGRGPQIEDMLFDFRITGHYRYPRD